MTRIQLIITDQSLCANLSIYNPDQKHINQ